jgi:hypothetical protein
MKSRIAKGVALLVLVALSPQAAHATAFEVTIDTTKLVGLGPFSFDVQLTDGDPGRITEAVLTAFVFGGGSPVGSPVLAGGTTGDFGTGVTLSDSGGFLASFTQRFEPGSMLKFLLTLTVDGTSSGIFPDALSIALLDSSGSEIPTTGFFDEFLTIEVGRRVDVFAARSDLSRTTLDVPEPTVGRSVPEPNVLALFAGAAILGVVRRRRAGRQMSLLRRRST